MKRIWEKGEGEAGFQFAEISLARGGENMEQPSLLLQLSSSIHQLNMAVDYTGGGEKEEGKERTRGEDLGKREERWWREEERGGEQGGF